MTVDHWDAAAVRSWLEPERGVFVGGHWMPGDQGSFSVDNPATLEMIARVADAGVEQAIQAVSAAADAGAAWAAMSPRGRSDILRTAYELMLRDREQLTALICLENGKAQSDAASEVSYAAEFFRWYAEEAVRPDGFYGSSPAGRTRTVVTTKPVGVAALVTPWNFPAAMATRKIAPALAAGCTLVLKPAAQTPLTALAIARLLAEAGVPDGVVNVVPTSTSSVVVRAWLDDPRVRKISFTGSTEVGRLLLRQAADRVLNASMELGGNAPFIVTADVDLSAAVAGAMVAKFRGGGQACTAANRFYVHADVADEFARLISERVELLRVGPASEATTEIGPVISADAAEDIRQRVREAISSGATVVGQAPLPGSAGHYVAPTVLMGVEPESRLIQEETFGPVLPIVTWTDEEQLLAMVNGTELGLAAYLYTGDLQRGLRLGEAIDAGMVGINRGLVSDPSAPFGGVKQSGLGREGAREGLREYTETQYLSIDWPDA
jgi:succinate-semialdehyde dehydrogenase/glutarate-semialdehyde dehydrogenase